MEILHQPNATFPEQIWDHYYNLLMLYTHNIIKAIWSQNVVIAEASLSYMCFFVLSQW